ncbi:MAG: hypothetical protein Q4B67_09390 [Eubacteriales bacterium]|nr:hypothetical protein [Eubacteriales bacterium]
MKQKYPVVTLCGSTRFKDEFLKAQKELTLQGMIVISVGLFGHSGDNEVWENMNEDTRTKTKLMLDDMHKSKIDMADEIFVVNPNGYIGESTWSEICYAGMTDKPINAICPIDTLEIDKRVNEHIRRAEELAWQQQDDVIHRQPYINEDALTYFIHKREKILDPWLCEDERMCAGSDFPHHGNVHTGFDPFKIYGKEKMARFVEDILMRH